MERAGRLLASWKAQKAFTENDLTIAAWPAAVGRRLASRTRALGRVGKRLVVEVDDLVWQRHLSVLSQQILQNLSHLMGDSAPSEVEFRMSIPKRPPMRVTPAETKVNKPSVFVARRKARA